MASEISEEQMAVYRATALRRRREREQALAARQERAWEIAREVAGLLRRDFGATRVTLIGSLARGKHFHERSDVDLIAWGVSESAYFKALAVLLSLDSDFSFDLITAESAPPIILEAVERDGKEL